MTYAVPSYSRSFTGTATPGTWTQPKRRDLSGGSTVNPQTVADAMMSGEAFSPYRSMMQEAQSAAELQKRADIANLINTKGLGNQGFGTQLARSSENDLMKSRYLNNLNTAMAEQEMKQVGANLGLDIQAQNEAERAARASESIARDQMESTSRLNEEKLRLAMDEITSSKSREDRELDLMEKELLLREKLGMGELDLNKLLGTGQLDISAQDLALREKLGLGELDLSKADLALREKLGTGELNLQKLLGLKGIESQEKLGTAELALREKLGLGELDVAGQELALRELLGLGELGLNNKELDLLSQYQNNQIALANKTLDIDTQVKMRNLDYMFNELNLRDREIMAQINLGNKELDAQDKQFMASLGMSERAQDWATEYQKMLIDIEKDKIKLIETDPTRAYTQQIIDEMYTGVGLTGDLITRFERR